jgi:hypothetical protein
MLEGLLVLFSVALESGTSVIMERGIQEDHPHREPRLTELLQESMMKDQEEEPREEDLEQLSKPNNSRYSRQPFPILLNLRDIYGRHLLPKLGST